MASTIAVRQELNKRGINNNRIGYDPNSQTVLVDNKPFLKPQQITSGTSYADPNSFNQAYQQLQPRTTQTTNQVTNELQGIPQGMGWQERLGYLQQRPELQQQEYQRIQNVANLSGVTGDTEAQQPAQNYLNQFLQATGYDPNANPYDVQVSQNLQGLLEQIRNPQQVNVQDIIGSPQYEAQQALAERQAGQATRQAQEALGGAGFGRSTRLAERAQNIQNEANQYLQTQVLPQLIGQEQQRQQQQLGNLMNALGMIQGQQGVYDVRSQQELQNQLAQESQALQSALARTQNAGKVVNEEDAAILGVPVGTPSFEAEQAAIANQLSRSRLSGGGGGGGEESLSFNDIQDLYRIWNSADVETRRNLQQQYPKIFGEIDLNSTTIDEYDLLQVDSLAEQSEIDYRNATPQQIRSFISQLKSQYGWSTEEAKQVENYMLEKARTIQRQIQQQQMQVQKEQQQGLGEITQNKGLQEISDLFSGYTGY